MQKQEEEAMKKFRTGVSVLVMVVAGVIGFFAGGFEGATLFAMVAGMACIIYTVDNQNSEE